MPPPFFLLELMRLLLLSMTIINLLHNMQETSYRLWFDLSSALSRGRQRNIGQRKSENLRFRSASILGSDLSRRVRINGTNLGMMLFLEFESGSVSSQRFQRPESYVN